MEASSAESPSVSNIQGNSLKDEGKAPRKLSITIPQSASSIPTDSDSITVQDTDLSSAHTSPTVAPSSPLDMKIGNSRAHREPEARPSLTSATDGLSDDPSTTGTSTGVLNHSFPPEMEAIMHCISGMKNLLKAMDVTFETFGRQTEKVADLAPAVDAAHRLKTLQTTFEEQRHERVKRIEDLRRRFEEAVPQLIEEYQAKVDGLVQEVVAGDIEDRVRQELQAQLPEKLRADVQQHERQLLEVHSELYNSEARRYNSSLASQESLTVPLRPLLRPLPTPEQSPTYIRSPMFTPVTAAPAGPLPTPSTAYPPTFSGPRSSLVPPTPSALFPRDLQSLLKYNARDARLLLAEYGLIEQTEAQSLLNTPTSAIGGSLQTPMTPTAPKAKGNNPEKDGKGQKAAPQKPSNTDSPNDGSREADLTKFMAHIGVPMKMVPNPGLKSVAKPGRPSLRVIITGPSVL